MEYQYEYTADAGFSGRMASAVFLFSISRRRGWLAIALVLVFVGLIMAGLGQSWPVVVALAVLAIGIGLGVSYLRLRCRMAVAAPAGSQYSIAFRDDGIGFRGPLAESLVKYAAYREAISRDGFVLLRAKNSRLYTIWPVELFPPAELAELRRRIAESAT